MGKTVTFMFCEFYLNKKKNKGSLTFLTTFVYVWSFSVTKFLKNSHGLSTVEFPTDTKQHYSNSLLLSEIISQGWSAKQVSTTSKSNWDRGE